MLDFSAGRQKAWSSVFSVFGGSSDLQLLIENCHCLTRQKEMCVYWVLCLSEMICISTFVAAFLQGVKESIVPKFVFFHVL